MTDSAVTDSAVSREAALLEVRDLTVHHGQLRALHGVSLTVAPGEVYAMIGANGAGKSTLLRSIAGLHKPTSGSILLDGQDLVQLRPEKRVAARSKLPQKKWTGLALPMKRARKSFNTRLACSKASQNFCA